MIKLSKRLQTCADLVRDGVKLADIGCDHGYVPVYLAEAGRIATAVASDINEGPLNSCRLLVGMHSLEDRIRCVLSDGLEEISSDQADDVLLAGMGGELIADILSRCDYAQEKHFILNPMTHPEIARQWLYEHGFEIENDLIVSDANHTYSIFDAYYTGDVGEKTQTDYFLGNIKDFSCMEYFHHLLNYLHNKQKGGFDYSEVISAIEERIAKTDDNS